MIENVYWSSYKVPTMFVRISRDLNFLLRFRKIFNITFHGNLPRDSRVVPCEQTDGRTDGRTDR